MTEPAPAVRLILGSLTPSSAYRGYNTHLKSAKVKGPPPDSA